MSEQSDTPSWWRCDTHGPGTRTAWGCPECVRELRERLAAATRERDEARALNVEWSKKAETWMASPEAAQRLQGYRELGQQVAKAQNERDEARAIANDRDAMVDHRDRALTAMYQRVDVITQERDEAIAEAVAKEREACAKACESQSARWFRDHSRMYVSYECAAAIRARAEKETK